MLRGFKEFIMRGNVVDLAIAVVIGTAFGAVVTALVADIITPIIAAIGGQPNFGNLKFTINGSTFKYGDFINKVISFLIVAAAIYFLIVAPLNRLAAARAARMAKGDPDPAPKADDIILLEQIRDLLSQQAPSSSPSPRPSPQG